MAKSTMSSTSDPIEVDAQGPPSEFVVVEVTAEKGGTYYDLDIEKHTESRPEWYAIHRRGPAIDHGVESAGEVFTMRRSDFVSAEYQPRTNPEGWVRFIADGRLADLPHGKMPGNRQTGRIPPTTDPRGIHGIGSRR